MITAARTCAVMRLRMHRFRNYAETTVHFGPDLNVIHGQNAQGKTNLLEAIATLALGRSPRAATSAELLEWSSDQALAEAEVARPAGSVVLSMRFSRDPSTGRVSRTVAVDGKPRPARAVLGLCPVVLFWPEDLALVRDGPDGRRRFLDVILAQTDPRIADHLARYRRVLDQRNALLHHLRAGGGGGDAMAGFTRELAEHGAPIAVARTALVAALAPLAAAALRDLSGGREHLVLRYAPAHTDAVAATPAEAERELLDALRARAADELVRGVTLAGPHRDDLDMVLDSRPARGSASQGQQRSIVLACKLAEVRHMQARSGTAPVILLDDVLGELDPERRAHLLALVAQDGPHQVLVTTTDPLGGPGGDAGIRTLFVRAGLVTVGPES